MYNTNSIKSHLIYSEEWDLALKFISERGVRDTGYATNSIGKGHYCYDVDGNLITEKEEHIKTGAIDAYSFNNIYDMAGNVDEWTMGTRYNSYSKSYRRQIRGGDLKSNGVEYPAGALDNTYANSEMFVVGFRVALYLK